MMGRRRSLPSPLPLSRSLRERESGRLRLFLAVGLIALVTAAPLHAHNLVDRNVQGISSATEIRIGPESIAIDFWVHIGDIEATNVRRAIDRNGDLRLSDEEKSTYFRVIESRVHDSGFSLEIDGEMVALTCAPIVVDYGKEPDAVGTEPIQYNVAATAALPKGADGEHRCAFYVQNTIDRPVLMKIYTLEDGGVRISAAPEAFADVQRAGLEGVKCGMTENLGVGLRFGTAVIRESLPRAPVADAAPGPQGMEERVTEDLKEYVRRVGAGDWSLWLIVSSIGVAAFFGGAHALAPGHGKTLVAAYLVGTRGRKMDAVTLGLTVTATHTSTVILSCLFAIWLQHRYNIDQADLAVWFGALGGLIIVGIGVYLLVVRIRALRTGIEPEHGHPHGPFGGHVHGPDGHDHGDGPHPHGHGTPPHVHGHAGHDPALVPHTHADGTTHTHAVGVEEIPELTPIESDPAPAASPSGQEPFPFWSLISLGISGGIVPCPTAIVILMGALSLGVPVYGLLLILAFGTGLAGVLVAIGLLMVTGRSRMDLSPRSERIVKRLPIASALLVTIIGVGLTVNALVEGGYLKP
ncbi:MAG: sulfite exporter TauE/SafE family protein [Planctomycetes bacterium]|nr:sulfite exporter TauE/SafE family protein [Planctomycetota bacterium]